MSSIKKNLKKYFPGIIILIIGSALTFLGHKFSPFLDPFFIYFFYYLFILFTKYLIISIATICTFFLVILFFKIRKRFINRKKFFLYLFLASLPVVVSFIFIYFSNKHCDFKQIVGFHYPIFITKDEKGFYNSDNIVNREMENGFRQVFSDPLKSNNILGNDKINLYETNIAKTVFDYYGYKKLPLEDIFSEQQNCAGITNWVETDNNGLIINIGVLNKFPIIIQSSSIDEYMQIKNRINRLAQLGMLSNYSKGIYLGKIYRATEEQFYLSQYISEGKYDQALIMTENSLNEFSSLNKILYENINSLQNESNRNKALEYIDDDFNSQLFYINEMRFWIYATKKDYSMAEGYLKKMFEKSLYLNSTDYKSYLKSFQEHYFYNKTTVSDEIALKRVYKTGWTRSLSAEEYNGEGLFALLQYSRINDDFDFEEFYKWLAEKNQNDPVLYMFLGKTYTDRKNYLEAKTAYNKALLIYPESPILKMLYEIANYNATLNSSIVSDEQKKIAKKNITEEMYKILSLPELAGFKLSPTCGGNSLKPFDSGW